MPGGRSVVGIVGLGVRRVVGRLTGPAPGRTVVCVLGVGLAVGVVVVVTGLSLGLAAGMTVDSEDVNYWIVPESGGTGWTPLAYEGTRLGDVHGVAASLRADEDVEFATPVAIQPLRLEHPETDDQQYVLAFGVVPRAGGQEIAGMDAAALDESYPFYADGRYDGRWTGELVVSPAVRDELGVATGDELRAGEEERPLRVEDVAAANPQAGVGETPAAVMHLAELQALTDTAAGDQADQILVVTTSNVRESLEGAYPETSVVTRAGVFTGSVTPTNLPLAVAVAAGIVALGVGVAFVATMMGLELTATRESLAVLDAVGFSRATVALVLVTETMTLTLLGGLLGVGIGTAGVAGLNAVLVRATEFPPVATFDPLLVGYGLAVAVAVGIVSVAYPVSIAWRTQPLEELTR